MRIGARLEERGALRYTPAGLEALDLVLAHEGESDEAGGRRKVTLQLRSVAFGAQARALEAVALGTSGDFIGFLASSRNGKGIILHIQSCTLA